MSLENRKKSGVHTKMSTLIKGRNSAQCRSHHQKMLAKYKSLDGIIEHFQDLLGKKLSEQKG